MILVLEIALGIVIGYLILANLEAVIIFSLKALAALVVGGLLIFGLLEIRFLLSNEVERKAVETDFLAILGSFWVFSKITKEYKSEKSETVFQRVLSGAIAYVFALVISLGGSALIRIFFYH